MRLFIYLKSKLICELIRSYCKLRTKYNKLKKQMRITKAKLDKVVALAAKYQGEATDAKAALKVAEQERDAALAKAADNQAAADILDDQALSDQIDAVIAKDEEVVNPPVEEPVVPVV